MLDFDGIMQELAKRRPVFHSEADLQHELGFLLRESGEVSRVRLEVPYQSTFAGRSHLDIYTTVRGHASSIECGLELKFAKDNLAVEHEGERFTLCFGADSSLRQFVLDVFRLEEWCKTPNRMGCAIMISNSPIMWKNQTSLISGPYEFSLHDGNILHGTIRWGPNAAASTLRTHGPVTLAGKYEVSWRPFSFFEGHRRGDFRYLAIPVNADRAATI